MCSSKTCDPTDSETVTMRTQKSELCSRYLKIFFVVTAYWIISIVTVFVNKTLLSGTSVGLEAPLFITWFQCIVSYVICVTLSRTGGIPGLFIFPKGNPWNVEIIKKGVIDSMWMHSHLVARGAMVGWGWRICVVQLLGTLSVIQSIEHAQGTDILADLQGFQVLPLSVMFTGMIATNNLCLKYVDVSFYYIGRSLTTVFNVVFSWILLRQSTSKRCILCCAFIVFGFFLGVDQESLIGSFSLIGTVFGVVGSLMLSLYSIYTKKVLPSVNQEVWLLSYYNNAYSIIIFLPLIVLNNEVPKVWNYEHLDSPMFWSQLVAGGLCGFAIGYVTSLQIQVTSPLTHNISGTAKACAQTVIATEWYNETKNGLWWLSNLIILGSSAVYARFKQLEMEANLHKSTKEERKTLV